MRALHLMEATLQIDEASERKLTFRAREFRGSRFRCLLATSMGRPAFVKWLNSLVQPFATVSENDKCMPEGFTRPAEADLAETDGFLNNDERKIMTSWWLAAVERPRTPNWDFLTTCTIAGREGLLLLEAKAHAAELKSDDRCAAGDDGNRLRIGQAIEEANTNLGTGWSLGMDRGYQLSSRFAWAWKIAKLGKPVVLVYLGFLNANEMPQPFADQTSWETSLRKYAGSFVPQKAWNSRIDVYGVPLIPLIRSADVNVSAA